MAKAIQARRAGDDYQALVFWDEALRMFRPTAGVVRVGFELDEHTAFDDVALCYESSRPHAGSLQIDADYCQVKHSVAFDKSVTADALIDPAFINADKVSLLERLRDAVAKTTARGMSHRFRLVCPWGLASDDPLGGIVNRMDGSVRIDRLFDGTGKRGRMGKVRHAWATRLGLSSEDELRPILSRFQIQPRHEVLDDVVARVNDGLHRTGMRPSMDGNLTNPYTQLIWRLSESQQWFTRDDIESAARDEGLWDGAAPIVPNEFVRLGIRSFSRWTERMEEDTDHLLCLVRYFDHRHIRDSSAWTSHVVPEIRSFLAEHVQRGQAYEMHLQALGSIACLAGHLLDPKLGVGVSVIQPGSAEPWRVRPTLVNKVSDRWSCDSIQVHGGQPDLAVAISLARPVVENVTHYVRESLPSIGRVLHLDLATGPSQVAIQSGTEAFALAEHLVRRVNQQRSPSERNGIIHLFAAAPNGFMFFFGQVGRSLGPYRLYEYDFEGTALGRYGPSIDVNAGLSL